QRRRADLWPDGVDVRPDRIRGPAAAPWEPAARCSRARTDWICFRERRRPELRRDGHEAQADRIRARQRRRAELWLDGADARPDRIGGAAAAPWGPAAQCSRARTDWICFRERRRAELRLDGADAGPDRIRVGERRRADLRRDGRVGRAERGGPAPRLRDPGAGARCGMQRADLIAAPTLDDEAGPPARRGAWLRFIARDKKALAGLIVLAALSLAALFAPLIAPHDPNDMMFDMIGAPSFAHPLGTDDLGRDLLSRLIYGARISLFVGVSTVLIALIAGVLLGVAAGYFGGFVDTIIMRYIDLQWAFPNFIIAVYLFAVSGTGLSTVIVAVSLAFVDDFARIARGMVLTIKEEQYVAAARVVGASDWRIMWRHILPNATAPLIVQATVSVSYAILAEAGLSFLGLGVEADTPTWGLILADARSFISRAWWLGVFPGLFIMITVLSINFVGDALRDLLDVREARDLAHA